MNQIEVQIKMKITPEQDNKEQSIDLVTPSPELTTDAVEQSLALSPWRRLINDFIVLMKPSITLLVLITTAGGIWLAPGEISIYALLASIIGTLGVVIGANTLNCYLERESDKEMARTKNRPLPAGRMHKNTALSFGLVITAISLLILSVWVNQTTTILALIAFISYVWIYTPMKRLSPQALIVGSVPGALPPLMGWTSVTGAIDLGGIALFGILFFWQIPHFIAIALYRQNEYQKAGLKTIPGEYGLKNALWQNLFWSVLLVINTLVLLPLQITGWIYIVIASILGGYLLYLALKGFVIEAKNIWARKFFLYTLIYISLLFAAFVIDAGPRNPKNQIFNTYIEK
jgi:protoheme IX farnesyltransferase